MSDESKGKKGPSKKEPGLRYAPRTGRPKKLRPEDMHSKGEEEEAVAAALALPEDEVSRIQAWKRYRAARAIQGVAYPEDPPASWKGD